MMIRTAIVAVSTLAMVSTAQAQDWQVASNARASVAMVTFENGISLGFRCSREAPLTGFLSGLPTAAGPGFNRRDLLLSWGRDEPVPSGSWWNSDAPGTVLNDSSAQLARALRRTGELHLVVPGAGAEGRNVRYVFQSPATWTGLDAFLQSCDVPLVDPLDEAPAMDIDTIVWERSLRPRFPASASAAQAVVRLNCITTADGRLEDCRALGEIPAGQDFAAEAIAAARDARVANVQGPGVPVPVRRISFTAVFANPDDNPRYMPEHDFARPDPTQPPQAGPP